MDAALAVKDAITAPLAEADVTDRLPTVATDASKVVW